MMTHFFVNCVFENVMFLLFSRIYDVIKIIAMTYFLLIAYLRMTCFYYFCGFVIIVMACFFANCVFENNMFTYILLYHLYQSNY